MTAQAPISSFDTSNTSFQRANDPVLPAAAQFDPNVQRAEGFAVIWRNAQRARSELLGIWFSRLVRRLWTRSPAGLLKLGAPRLPSAEREESTQAG
jgi:hypothetical protein